MWATAEDLTTYPELWTDAPDTPATVDFLLGIATEACEAYAPPLPEGDDPVPVPTSYKMATILHARELHNASKRGEQDVIGVGDFAIRARPLTAAVKQLLRPKRGFGGVG